LQIDEMLRPQGPKLVRRLRVMKYSHAFNIIRWRWRRMHWSDCCSKLTQLIGQ